LLYRGTNSDFTQAAQRAVVAGNIFYDNMTVEKDTDFFYWIQIVSVYGTVGATVGPASATAHPRKNQTLEDLTGLIDSGVLATALKTDISGIPLLDGKIIDEINARIDSNKTLAAAFESLNFEFEGTKTLVQQSITERLTADEAFVQSLNTMQAVLNGHGAAINEEKTVRATKDDAIASSVTTLQAKVDTNAAAITTEVTARANADSALSTRIDTYAAKTDTNTAAIANEVTARTTKTDALASDISILYTKTGDNKAAIDTEKQARTDAVSAQASLITALSTRMGSAESAIQTEQTTRATADTAQAKSVTDLASRIDGDLAAIRTTQSTLATNDSARATQITNLTTTVGQNSTAIQNEITARTNADSSLSSQISASESRLNGQVATVQTNLQTNINSVDGRVTAIGALYTAKVQVNGLIGGFGVYNDGTTVEAGFDVDRFWIGRTSSEKVKPFIIDNGVVYIDKAKIRNADIDTLKIAGNAVTTAVSAYSSWGAGLSGGDNSVQSLGFYSSGAPVIVGFGCAVSPAGYAVTNNEGSQDQRTSSWSMAIYRDGYQLFSTDGPKQGYLNPDGAGGVLYFQVQDTPGAGYHTYEMRVYVNVGGASGGLATSRIINLLEVKR
jgi:hypothetical protein